MSRVVDQDLLQRVREQNCVACGASPCDPHHVKTRGAGGGDIPTNVMPLCRKCHTEWHAIGPSRMSNRHPGVYRWLVQMGREDVLAKAAEFSNG